MERTTNLKELREGLGFTWGELLKIHEVDNYTIVEYSPWRKDGVRLLTGQPDHTKTEFSCYVDDRSLSRSTYSLDAALAECIAYKHEGLNSRAAQYFMKMIDIPV